MPITETARAILTAATDHPYHLANPPERLPVAARRAVIQSMMKAGLVEEAHADDEQPAWRTGDDGVRYMLQATEAGLRAVKVTAGETEPTSRMPPDRTAAAPKPTAAPRAALMRLPIRSAAQAVLTAWDDPAEGHPGLPEAVAALRAALSARRAPGSSEAPRQPRPDTKRAAVLALLRRQEGATVAQVAEATGWATHTVRGFFAGLKKVGITVEVLDRVRQVGPRKGGAKGSYTVYGITDAG